MSIHKKPYLVIPHLIEQPTWGGDYILETKNWTHKTNWQGKKIGQSYELYSGTKLAQDIRLSADRSFGPEYKKTIDISHFGEDRPFPLIKFTQAKGNSFQLHTKPGTTDPRWLPKAESWYYFESGKITLGIKKGADMTRYKQVCKEIELHMKDVSAQIRAGRITLEDAKHQAHAFITAKDPWQFVNVYNVAPETLIDLSGGGLHHSWEEDEDNPLGNVVYEVQQDVMDPVSTIRSFDQGKIMEDGTIREIHIDDYFTYLDQSEERNTYIPTQGGEGELLFTNPHYSLARLAVNVDRPMHADTSFHHLFVKEGEVKVIAGKDEIVITRGHSGFIPKGVTYVIHPDHPSIVLHTFLGNS